MKIFSQTMDNIIVYRYPPSNISLHVEDNTFAISLPIDESDFRAGEIVMARYHDQVQAQRAIERLQKFLSSGSVGDFFFDRDNGKHGDEKPAA